MKKNFWKNRLEEWTDLDPIDRISEVLFGLIMVLIFTGTISISTTGRQEVHELLWAALGCNLAWGLVDAIMYLMDELFDRAHNVSQMKLVFHAKNKAVSREIIRENISPLISDLMNDNEIDHLGEKFKKLPEPTQKTSLTVKDFFIATQIFLLVFLSTFPVAAPFILIQDVELALRVSNGVALLLLFTAGFSLAKYAGLKPFLTALIYTALGIFLVLLTMVLGG